MPLTESAFRVIGIVVLLAAEEVVARLQRLLTGQMQPAVSALHPLQ